MHSYLNYYYDDAKFFAGAMKCNRHLKSKTQMDGVYIHPSIHPFVLVSQVKTTLCVCKEGI